MFFSKSLIMKKTFYIYIMFFFIIWLLSFSYYSAFIE